MFFMHTSHIFDKIIKKNIYLFWKSYSKLWQFIHLPKSYKGWHFSRTNTLSRKHILSWWPKQGSRWFTQHSALFNQLGTFRFLNIYIFQVNLQFSAIFLRQDKKHLYFLSWAKENLWFENELFYVSDIHLYIYKNIPLLHYLKSVLYLTLRMTFGSGFRLNICVLLFLISTAQCVFVYC